MLNVMYSRYVLTIAAFVVIIMMDVLYFSKAKTNNKTKHKMYSYLIIVNTFLLLLELIIMALFGIDAPFTTCVVAMKTRDLFLMGYFIVVLFYYYTAVNDIEHKSLWEFLKSEKIIYPHLIFTIIVLIVHTFLPYNEMDKYTYSNAFGGLAFYLTIAYCVITTLETIFIILFKNKKGINYSEKLSLVLLFFLMMIILIFQTIFSGVAIMGLISSIYIIGLYFIFENPDLELVEEINSLTLEAERATHSKLDFLSNVSKEMITPMNTITKLSGDILNGKETDSDKIKDDVVQIELASKNFLEILNNAIDISNVDNENDALYESNYSLTTLLKSLTKVAQEKVVNKKVQVVLNVDNDIPNNLYGDSTKIYQILLNILSNSIKFTEVGKIGIRLNQEIKNNRIILKFKISDTGFGIKEEDYDKVFKQYTRLDDAVSRGIEGTGLGLAIAKQYVDLLGGEIRFESIYGAGTTFYVEVPQQIVAMIPTLGEVTDEDEKDEEDKKLLDCSKYRLLVVEDDKLNLEVTKRLLKRYGFIIDTCSNGKDCIFKFKKGEHYDMMLVDHIMPEMDGVEVVRVIRKLDDYKAPPIVALTANAFTGSRDIYLKEGFDDYLAKPIDMTELDTLVNKYFKKKI